MGIFLDRPRCLPFLYAVDSLETVVVQGLLVCTLFISKRVQRDSHHRIVSLVENGAVMGISSRGARWGGGVQQFRSYACVPCCNLPRMVPSAGQNVYCGISSAVIQRMSLCSSI